MKIARAWSVGEAGKGEVSRWASQSREGTVWRGNLAAWLSGAEKSRQVRQDSGVGWEVDCGCWAPGFGFVARSFERSGLEDKGRGGGCPFTTGSVSAWAPLGAAVAAAGFWGLFIPNERADRAGIAGGLSGGSFLTDEVESFLIGGCGGLCGGREGRLGGLGSSMVVTFGVDLVGFRPILDLSMS